MDWASDFWADDDGPVDTEENRKEFPEGFKWDCCNISGESKYEDSDGEEWDGCEHGTHIESKTSSRKKRKYTS